MKSHIPILVLFFLEILYPAGTVDAGADENARFQQFAKHIQNLTRYEYGQSRTAMTGIDQYLRDLPAESLWGKKAEQEIISVLKTDIPSGARQYLCETLSLIGTAEAVGVLSDLLKNPQAIESARYALERIPGPEATEALRSALSMTSGKNRIGIIHSLAVRKDTLAFSELEKLLNPADRETTAAVLGAMGTIADENSLAAIRDFYPQAPAELRSAATEALLSCAAALLQNGKNAEAHAIYQEIFSDTNQSLIARTASLRGLVASQPDQSGPQLTEVLQSSQENLHAEAATLLRETAGNRTVLSVADSLRSFAPETQVLVFEALGDRGNPAVLESIEKACGSESASVRVAAFTALGKLGNATHVQMLAETAASRSGEEKQAARQSLYQMNAKDVNQIICDKISSAPAAVKTELIQAIGQRNIQSAIPILLQEAKNSDASVRRTAWQNLRMADTAETWNAMLSLLIQTQNPSEQAMAEKTLAASADKIESKDPLAQQILTLFPNVQDIQAKSSLLRLLGSLGNDDGLPILTVSLGNPDPALRRAAIRALSGWPTDSPANHLLETAKHTPEKTDQILALRGYLELADRKAGTDKEEGMAMFLQTVPLAHGVDEKRMILSGWAKMETLEAMQKSLQWIHDGQVHDEAVAAVLQNAQVINRWFPLQVRDAMKSILETGLTEENRKIAQSWLDLNFLTTWQLAGPYSKQGLEAKDLFTEEFAAEKDEQSAAWKTLPDYGNEPNWNGKIDLAESAGPLDLAVVYLRCWVWSDVKQKASMELGSDDAVKVWVNGSLVHANNTERSCRYGDDEFRVNLEEGWNRIMLKVVQNEGKWSACVRIRQRGGFKLDDLRWQAEPPKP